MSSGKSKQQNMHFEELLAEVKSNGNKTKEVPKELQEMKTFQQFLSDQYEDMKKRLQEIISLIDCPTRFMMNQTPSLLYHIYTNQHDKNIHSGTIAFPISDHHPTYALIENGFKKCQRPPIYKRYSHNFQLDDYITDLSLLCRNWYITKIQILISMHF